MADACSEVKNVLSYACPFLPAYRSFKKAYEFSKRVGPQAEYAKDWSLFKGCCQLLKGTGITLLLIGAIFAAIHGSYSTEVGLFCGGAVAFMLGAGRDCLSPEGYTQYIRRLEAQHDKH